MSLISDCQVRDPRIRRTRKLLQGALEILMQSKGFDEISVQDITETATVNRATFYDHYTDKFALLEALVAGRFHEFLDQRKVRYEAGCPAAVGAIIGAVCDFITQAHSRGACERQAAYEPLMDAAMARAIQRLLIAGLQQVDQASQVSREMVAAAASAAICGGVKQWFSLADRPPVEAMVSQLQALVLPMLAAATAESPAAGLIPATPAPVTPAPVTPAHPNG